MEHLKAEISKKEPKVSVSWRPPREDGKSPITGYEVEFRANKRRGWQQLRLGPGDDSDILHIPTDRPEYVFSVGDKETANCLEGGSDYLFRVVAINEVGKSEPVETRTAIKSPATPSESSFVLDPKCRCCGKLHHRFV